MFLAALTVGSALPYLIATVVSIPWRLVFLAGGVSSDRWGRKRTAIIALGTSGLCCLLSPLAFHWATWAIFLFVVVWGASVIADSGVFSTVVSEITSPRYVGTALAFQTAIGFLLTVVTIQLLPLVASALSWQFAFLVLAPGPIVGVTALVLFRESPRRPTHD